MCVRVLNCYFGVRGRATIDKIGCNMCEVLDNTYSLSSGSGHTFLEFFVEDGL